MNISSHSAAKLFHLTVVIKVQKSMTLFFFLNHHPWPSQKFYKNIPLIRLFARFTSEQVNFLTYNSSTVKSKHRWIRTLKTTLLIVFHCAALSTLTVKYLKILCFGFSFVCSPESRSLFFLCLNEQFWKWQWSFDIWLTQSY